MNDETPSSIHAFWFGHSSDDAETAKQQAALWWGKNAQVDADMSRRFSSWLERAAAGALNHWEESAASLLALILLTDQFSRNIHRGKAESFASDALARRWAQLGLQPEVRQAQRPIERVFMLLPFEHSEAITDQDLSVREFEALAADAAETRRETFAGFADYARRHRDIIARFGRFPHRNAILGRPSSTEESAFLLQPGSSF